MKVNRIRYQFGSLCLWEGREKRSGTSVWYFRYRDYDENGKRCQRNLKVPLAAGTRNQLNLEFCWASPAASNESYSWRFLQTT
jgi:hypothetical protein